MKPFRSTLLFLLAAAALTFFLWLTKDTKGTDEAEKAKGKLFDFVSDDVTSLKIRSADGTISLEKKEAADGQGNQAGWRIAEPVSAEAEREAVLSILGELEFLQPRRTIAAAEIPDGDKSLAEWGLSPAAARIDIAGKTNGKDFSATLLVGRKAAIDGLYYAKLADTKADADAYLIAATSRDALFRKLDDLRSRVVIHAAALGIDQCGLRQKAPAPAAPAPAAADAPSEFQIGRSGEEWRVEKPLSAPASKARVEAWLGQLDALRVKQFISDDAADLTAYGLTAPAAQIWIRRAAPPAPAQDLAAKDKAKPGAPKPSPAQPQPESEPDTLLVGIPVPGVPGEVYAKRAGESGVFTLPEEGVNKLLADLPAARDRKVLAFNASDAVAFRVELPKSSAPGALSIVEVRKDGTRWLFGDATTGGGAGKEADAAQVEAFLKELSVTEAPKIVRDTASDLKPYGLGLGSGQPPIRLVVTVKSGAGTEERTLSLGKVEKVGAQQLLYAANSTQPFVYGLDISFLTRFPREAWRWRSPLVFGSGLTEATLASVARAAGGKDAETLKRGEGGFVSNVPGTLAQDKAQAVWSKLASLSAVHWIGAPLPAYGLGGPSTVRLFVTSVEDGKEKQHILLLGAPVSAVPVGGRAAQIADDGDVFLISEADYAVLTAPLSAAAAGAAESAPKP